MEEWAQEQRELRRQGKPREGKLAPVGLDIDILAAQVAATIPWATPERVRDLTVWQGVSILNVRNPEGAGNV